jgi:hypothetical protein
MPWDGEPAKRSDERDAILDGGDVSPLSSARPVAPNHRMDIGDFAFSRRDIN